MDLCVLYSGLQPVLPKGFQVTMIQSGSLGDPVTWLLLPNTHLLHPASQPPFKPHRTAQVIWWGMSDPCNQMVLKGVPALAHVHIVS